MSENATSITIGDKIIKVVRRKGQKHMRIRVGSDGQAVVSVPLRYPLYLTKQFVISKAEWIEKHTFTGEIIQSDAKLHTGHRIQIFTAQSTKNKTRFHEEVIEFWLAHDPKAQESQKYMLSKIHGLYAMLLQGYVRQRLQYFTSLTGLIYGEVSVKRMKSKWGHCDRQKNITFSTYLIACDDPLIDYVVLHELMHTRHMNHSAEFWRDIEQYMPEYKSLRSALKTHKMQVTA